MTMPRKAFDVRWSWWVRMRAAMHWRAYESESRRHRRSLAFAGLCGILSFYVVLFGVLVLGKAWGQMPRDAARYEQTLKREAQRVWGLQAPVASFAAQIHQESRWRADARSPVGALGLTQFMPATASWIAGAYPSLAADGGAAPMNPTWAIRALVTYDRHLWDRVKAVDDCQRMAFAMSAYNGGLGWVYKRQRLSPTPSVCLGATCTINPGIKPAAQRENEHYPRHILLAVEPLYEGWGPGVCP